LLTNFVCNPATDKQTTDTQSAQTDRGGNITSLPQINYRVHTAVETKKFKDFQGRNYDFSSTKIDSMQYIECAGCVNLSKVKSTE